MQVLQQRELPFVHRAEPHPLACFQVEVVHDEDDSSGLVAYCAVHRGHDGGRLGRPSWWRAIPLSLLGAQWHRVVVVQEIPIVPSLCYLFAGLGRRSANFVGQMCGLRGGIPPGGIIVDGGRLRLRRGCGRAGHGETGVACGCWLGLRRRGRRL